LTEAELQTEVFKLCEQYGHMCFHSTDARLDHGPGYPDLTIVGQHGVIFAELKQQFAGHSREQTVWRYRLQAAGQDYRLWRPYDLFTGTIEDTLKTL
jgi:hypothetical protein